MSAAPSPTAADAAPAAGATARVHVALFAVQIMFASLSIAGKIALRELEPFALVAVRAGLAALVLLAIRCLRPWRRVDRRDLPSLALYAALGITANQLLFVTGLARSTASNALVLGATIPIFTFAAALVLGRERPSGRTLVGLLVALAGALIVIGGDRFEARGDYLLGDLLIIGNSLCYALYLVLSRRLLARYDALTMVTWIVGLGAIGVLPFGGLPLVHAAPHLSATTWLAVGLIVAFPTVGTYFLNAYALRRAPASLVAIYIYVQPILGMVAAHLLLGEALHGSAALGGLAIAAGVWLVSRRSPAPRGRSPDDAVVDRELSP